MCVSNAPSENSITCKGAYLLYRTQNDGWSALHYAAANDAALAAEVLVQYDVSLKTRTESTKETALEMAERLRSHLVAILLYEMTYRKR